MGERYRRQRRTNRIRRFALSRRVMLLTLGTAFCSLLSAVSGWSMQPTLLQTTAATCGCAIAASMYLADKQSDMHPALKKNTSSLLGSVMLPNRL